MDAFSLVDPGDREVSKPPGTLSADVGHFFAMAAIHPEIPPFDEVYREAERRFSTVYLAPENRFGLPNGLTIWRLFEDWRYREYQRVVAQVDPKWRNGGTARETDKRNTVALRAFYRGSTAPKKTWASVCAEICRKWRKETPPECAILGAKAEFFRGRLIRDCTYAPDFISKTERRRFVYLPN